VSKATDGQTRYLFASLDDGLRRVARMLFGYGTDTGERDELITALSQWWSPSDAAVVADALHSLYGRADDANRQVHRQQVAAFIDNMIAAGEAELSAWQHGQVSAR